MAKKGASATSKKHPVEHHHKHHVVKEEVHHVHHHAKAEPVAHHAHHSHHSSPEHHAHHHAKHEAEHHTHHAHHTAHHPEHHAHHASHHHAHHATHEHHGSLEMTLAQNLVDLQHVHTRLLEKMNKVSDQLGQLLSLFEVAAHTFTQAQPSSVTDKDREFLDKIDKLLEQNKIIARGLMLMDEKMRQKMGSEAPAPIQQFRQSAAPQFTQPRSPTFSPGDQMQMSPRINSDLYPTEPIPEQQPKPLPTE